jgi:hypothetical protein
VFFHVPPGARHTTPERGRWTEAPPQGLFRAGTRVSIRGRRECAAPAVPRKQCAAREESAALAVKGFGGSTQAGCGHWSRCCFDHSRQTRHSSGPLHQRHRAEQEDAVVTAVDTHVSAIMSKDRLPGGHLTESDFARLVAGMKPSEA